MKMKRLTLIPALLLICALFLSACGSTVQVPEPTPAIITTSPVPEHAPSPSTDAQPGFVLVSEAAPDVIEEMRYFSTYNFMGRRASGYEEPVAILTIEAAAALKAACDELAPLGYRIRIYDAYRPQSAVNDFSAWASDVSDVKMKDYFYPDVDKSRLFELGYIAARSGHSRGSTVDVTLFDMALGRDVDMGSAFDYFGDVSHTDCQEITDAQRENRMILQRAMLNNGFLPYSGEWWHFTLADELYPDTYFDFPVSSSSVE